MTQVPANQSDEALAQEADLIVRASNGDGEAFGELAMLKRPYLRWAAHRFECPSHHDDLVAEGEVALAELVVGFDGRVTVNPVGAFRTLLAYRVKARMRTYFVEQVLLPIRVPPKAARRMLRVQNERETLRKETGREPTAAEIAPRVGTAITEARVRFYLDLIDSVTLDAGWVQEEMPMFVSPERGALRSEGERAQSLVAAKALRPLSPRERGVVIRRFGLDGEPPENCGEQARRDGCSIPAVWSAQKRALAFLKRVLTIAALGADPALLEVPNGPA